MKLPGVATNMGWPRRYMWISIGSTLNSGRSFLKSRRTLEAICLAAFIGEKLVAVFFVQRRVEREDIVFLFVAGLIADGPIGDDEIGEGVAGAPGVVAAIVDGLVEDHVDDRDRARSGWLAWRRVDRSGCRRRCARR